VTDQPGLLLAVRVADCVPVLLAGGEGRVVAAVHAGWRGIIAGVLPAAVKTFADSFHLPAPGLVAAIGPCISGVHFEVGPEVARAFVAAGLAPAVQGTTASDGAGAKPHIDLRRAARMQLEQEGIPARAIDDTDRCTYTHAAEFFSHRRDHGVTGRMAAAIACAP
jgi:YfiH family protein